MGYEKKKLQSQHELEEDIKYYRRRLDSITNELDSIGLDLYTNDYEDTSSIIDYQIELNKEYEDIENLLEDLKNERHS